MRNILVIVVFLLSPTLFAATDPTEINVQVLALYMSKEAYCGSPIEVFTTSEPGFVDFLGGPTVGQLDNSKFHYDGNYKCIIIKMSETIKFVPLLGSGVCVAGNKFETNLCASGVVTTGVDGSTSTCTSSGGDSVYLYLSTGSTAATLSTSTNPFAPPTALVPTNGLTLANSIQISGSINLKFTVNAFSKIGAISGVCDIDNPSFSFGYY